MAFLTKELRKIEKKKNFSDGRKFFYKLANNEKKTTNVLCRNAKKKRTKKSDFP